MGRDKALLADGTGRPLWDRQYHVLHESGAQDVFLNVRPAQTWSRDTKGFAAILHDTMPGCGPIVGITAALERSAKGHVAALAIDLAHIEPRWFAELAAECTTDRGCVGRRAGFFEPLAAIYPRSMMFLMWEALARHEYSLQKLLTTAVELRLMSVREIAAEEAERFANWNEPPAAGMPSHPRMPPPR